MPAAEAPVLVAPDAFPGSLRAAEVAGAVGRGLERAGLRPPDCCPLADGGEGTVAALLPALGGELVAADVRGDDGGFGRAHVALLEGGGAALVEVAAAGGRATTHGAGELIAAAARTGAAVVLVAAGGRVPADGGAGALEAIAGAGGLGGARVVVLCEVRLPWERAAPGGFDAIAARLRRDPRGVPMTGAAGGLAGALWAEHGAALEPGARWVLDALGVDARLRAARALVTGEGRLDAGTLEGRPVAEICTRARQLGVPAHAIVGRDAMDRFDKRLLDLQVVLEAGDLPALEAAGEALGERLRTGAA